MNTMPIKSQEPKPLKAVDTNDWSFREMLLCNIIPLVEQMIEKEKQHIEWLKSRKTEEEIVEESQHLLDHYYHRLKEYIECAQRLAKY